MFGVSSDAGYIEIISGISIKTLNYGPNSIMVEFRLTKGAVLPEHNHIPEQTGYLVKGSIRLFIDEKLNDLQPGDS
jgi:quercetin dioxygenase-like cupin family protein